jgi:HEPN domain-containing protein
MTPLIKSLILKAQDNLDTAKKHLDDQAQHDVVGYNLAQSCENFLKALCSLRNLEYPHDEQEGHDLDTLMQILEDDNMTVISSHADVIELTPYNYPQKSVRPADRLDLKEYYGYVESLKSLVGRETL